LADIVLTGDGGAKYQATGGYVADLRRCERQVVGIVRADGNPADTCTGELYAACSCVQTGIQIDLI